MADSPPGESKIAKLRKAKGWSQQDLGVRAGLHGITVSEIERGATDPKLSSLEAIARALGVEVADLLNGDPKVAAS